MVNPDPELSPAQQTLLSIYQQWIDLARARDDQSHVRRFCLWHDDDNPIQLDQANRNPASPPVLASESMLCFLLPTFSWEPYSIFPITTANPIVSRNASEVRKTLTTLCEKAPRVQQLAAPLTDASFQHLFGLIEEYYDQITDDMGKVSFAGHTYFSQEHEPGAVSRPTDARILNLPVTDAFSVGLSVSLRILRLLWQHRTFDRDAEASEQVRNLRKRSAEQLTASIRGLLRTFVVHTIDEASWDDVTDQVYLWKSINALPDIRHMRHELRNMGYALNPERAFECGWSWGPTSDLETSEHNGPVPEEAPYLYFTWTALEGIADLSDPSLNAEELIIWLEHEGLVGSGENILRDASRLRTLAAVTSSYWTILARQHPDIGDDNTTDIIRLTRIPWRTTDRDESEYYTLYILGILRRREAGGLDPRTTIDLLEELSVRGRITTSPLKDAVAEDRAEMIVRVLHKPGKLISLYSRSPIDARTADDSAHLRWRIFDYAPLLLKMAAHARSVATDHQTKRRAIRLVDALLTHLQERQIDSLEERKLTHLRKSNLETPDGWTPGNYLDKGMLDSFASYAGLDSEEFDGSSWYLTERTVEALLAVLALSPLRLVASNLQSLVDEIAAELDNRGLPVAEALRIASDSPAHALSMLMTQLKDLG